MLNIENGQVKIGEFSIDYARFSAHVGGESEPPPKTLFILTGLGTEIADRAKTLARTYKAFAKDYDVYVFGRKNDIEKRHEIYSTEEMATDIYRAAKALGIAKAHVLGVSLGGMIAQHLAISHPDFVDKLVLTVTVAKPNPLLEEVVGGWKKMAQEGDYGGILRDAAKRSYSSAFLEKHPKILSFAGRGAKAEDYRDFCIQADAAMRHDSTAGLSGINCPTLIFAGADDRIVGASAGRDLAATIKGSRLLEYEGLSHAADEEVTEYDDLVLEFLA